MFGNSLFGKSLDIQQRILGVDSLRKEVIADNIANVDTPQFKRKMVSFESELNRALDSETAEQVPTNRTESRHFDFNDNRDWRSVKSRVQVEYDNELPQRQEQRRYREGKWPTRPGEHAALPGLDPGHQRSSCRIRSVSAKPPDRGP
jgi:flagellar basal-body rod protein FlgB